MMDSFVEKVKRYMDLYEMLPEEGRVIVGLSGGADSVCLLRTLDNIRTECPEMSGLEIRAVHVNHMIRGKEADEDQLFVETLCESLGIGIAVYKEDIPKLAQELHMTVEEAGRHFRYECFQREADGMGEGTLIAVAHNKDDLAETVIYNMIRGSSLLGLAGIKPVRDRIIRPLLNQTRAEIEGYLETLEQDYRTDSTNLSVDYTRNKIRLGVIPMLKEINENAVGHIVSIAEDAALLGDSVSERTQGLASGSLSIEVLEGMDTFTAGELVLASMEAVCGRRKDITREHIGSVLRLMKLESGKKVDLPYQMEAVRVYDRIDIRKKTGIGDGSEMKPEKEQDKELELGTAEYRTVPYEEGYQISKKEYTKTIDYDKIKSTLCLRTAQPQDYMVINAAGGTKKLARIFTDAKIEREKRSRIPVIADGDEIVWVIGLRLSERYKITPETKTVLEISYTKEK